MARIDSLRLLLMAEPVQDVESIELLLSAIVDRIDELEPGSPTHQHAHSRIDSLLELRDRLVVERDRASVYAPGAG